MRITNSLLGVSLAAISGCVTPETASPLVPPPQTALTAWRTDWSELVGRTVTLEGTAADAKLGALLLGGEGAIWIEGVASWPDGFWAGGQGTRLRVVGTVIRKDDLPVFAPQPGEPAPAGIPVESGQELEKAKRHYLLRNATWTVVE